MPNTSDIPDFSGVNIHAQYTTGIRKILLYSKAYKIWKYILYTTVHSDSSNIIICQIIYTYFPMLYSAVSKKILFTFIHKITVRLFNDITFFNIINSK